MSEATVTITGRVATEVRHAVTNSGVPLAKFRLASSKRTYDRGQGMFVDGPASFVTVECWRFLADNVAASLKKGEPVIVSGQLKVEEWTRDDGRPTVTAEISASSIGHDLSWGTTTFARPERTQATTRSDADLSRELGRRVEEEATARGPGTSTSAGFGAGNGSGVPSNGRDGGSDPAAHSGAAAGAERQAV